MYRNLRLLSALQMMTGDERLERQARDNKNSNEGEKLHRFMKKLVGFFTNVLPK